MKKIFCIALSTVLLISFTACKSEAKSGKAKPSTAKSATTKPSVTGKKPSQTVIKPTPTGAISKATTNSKGAMRDISATELVAEMKIGWNLGNSLDATGKSSLDSETSWGNPATTQKMIDAVAAGGFNTIRIPTTWYKHIIDDKYTIDSAWLKRVKEVIDYAMANDMYVILNMHHEDEWQIPDYGHIDKVKTQFTTMWTQIAKYYSDYGDHLLFEGLNEPRVIGGVNEWNGGTDEGRDCVNQLNQLFIDTVRATGGNNIKRGLLITTFAAQVSTNSFQGYKFPKNDRIILSLHAYTPYRFTYDSKNESWNTFTFDSGVEAEIQQMFNTISKFTGKTGIPVILTECGAASKRFENGSRNTEEVAKWMTSYLSIAKKQNIPCVLWDNGYYNSGNELFGLFNRQNCTWFEPSVIDAAMKVYKNK